VYPLFGAGLERRVHALGADDVAALRRAVQEQRLDFLFVARGGRYDRWAGADPERYAAVSGGSKDAAVYRVLHAAT
jgi:hypothetical protein